MKRSPGLSEHQKRRRRKNVFGRAFRGPFTGKDKRIKSRRAKRKAARERTKKRSAKQLLALQRHRAVVGSVFYSIAIVALLVIGLMLLTIATDKPREWPTVVAFQSEAPEDKPEEPAKKAKVQLSSSRPQLPSVKLIQANISSPVAIRTVKIELPTVEFEMGTEIEGLDFGNGGWGQGNGFGQKGSLGGMDISAKQLGVVLDVSGSMSSVLPILEKQIASRFPWALTRRVRGCQITGDFTQADDQDSTLSAIKYLVEEGEADAIFWFCDLQDTRDIDSVRSLGKYLRENRVKLYLSSTSKRPDADLKKAVTKSSLWSAMGK